MILRRRGGGHECRTATIAPGLPVRRALALIGLAVLLVATGIATYLWLVVKSGRSLALQAQCAAKAGVGGPWSGGVYHSHYNP